MGAQRGHISTINSLGKFWIDGSEIRPAAVDMDNGTHVLYNPGGQDFFHQQ